jgi:hypothetical protein
MPAFTFTAEQSEAFRSCVEVGADGLGSASRREISEVLASGSTMDVSVPGKSGPDVTFVVPGHALQDLRSAFVVGWEGLEEPDDLLRAADEAAEALGLARPSPPAP